MSCWQDIARGGGHVICFNMDKTTSKLFLGRCHTKVSSFDVIVAMVYGFYQV